MPGALIGIKVMDHPEIRSLPDTYGGKPGTTDCGNFMAPALPN